MMNGALFRNLVMQSIADPRAIARWLIALRLGREARWMALGLAAVLSSLTMMLGNVLLPPTVPLPAIFTSPMLFAALLVAALAGMSWSVAWAVRMLGGTATPGAIMVLLSWVQGLRVLVQVVVLVLVMLPGGAALSVLISFAASILGIWITVNFVDEVAGFGNLFKSFAALLLGALMVVMGMALFWSLIGPPPEMGLYSDV